MSAGPSLLRDRATTPLIRIAGICPEPFNCYLKPDFRNHPFIRGNKLWKLAYPLQQAIDLGYQRILSFGGAYSNHLYALALAGRHTGLKVTALIRGERPATPGFTMRHLAEQDVELIYLDRQEYRQYTRDPEALARLAVRYPEHYILPEGGSSTLAMQGLKHLAEELEAQALELGDPKRLSLVLPAGTGATAAGLIACLGNTWTVHVVNVLKNPGLTLEMQRLWQQASLTPRAAWEVRDDFHFGGYARFDRELLDFATSLHRQSGIVADPVYNAKSIYAAGQLASRGILHKDVVILHTGGLQGNAGFIERYGPLIPDSEER